jgi:hypothetical protein
MPRNFGLPTNREMQQEWAEDSLAIYREAAKGIVDAFTYHPAAAAWLQGKPLNALQIGFVHMPLASTDPLSKINTQSIMLGVRNPNEEFGHTTEDGLDEETRERLMTDIHTIGRLTLEPQLDIGMIKDPRVIGAEYEAAYAKKRDGRGVEYTPKRETSTYYGRPSKMHLALARGFSDMIGDYVQTEDFQKFPLGLAPGQLIQRLTALDADRTGHIVRMRMVPGLPLNGSESDSFLLGYHNKMQEGRVGEERALEIYTKRKDMMNSEIFKGMRDVHERNRETYAESEQAAWDVLQRRILGDTQSPTSL